MCHACDVLLPRFAPGKPGCLLLLAVGFSSKHLQMFQTNQAPAQRLGSAFCSTISVWFKCGKDMFMCCGGEVGSLDVCIQLDIWGVECLSKWTLWMMNRSDIRGYWQYVFGDTWTSTWSRIYLPSNNPFSDHLNFLTERSERSPTLW